MDCWPPSGKLEDITAGFLKECMGIVLVLFSVLVLNCCVTNDHKPSGWEHPLPAHYLTAQQVRSLGRCGWAPRSVSYMCCRLSWAPIQRLWEESVSKFILAVGRIQLLATVRLGLIFSCWLKVKSWSWWLETSRKPSPPSKPAMVSQALLGLESLTSSPTTSQGKLSAFTGLMWLGKPPWVLLLS